MKKEGVIDDVIIFPNTTHTFHILHATHSKNQTTEDVRDDERGEDSKMTKAKTTTKRKLEQHVQLIVELFSSYFKIYSV